MTIFGVVLTVLCLFLFGISYRNRKNRKNKKIQLIANVAAQHNCRITQHELCGDFIIGMDDINRFVFFLKNKSENEISRFINLAEIRDCKISNKSRTVTNNGSSTTVIDRLSLLFEPILKNNPEMELEFFNSEENTQLSGELQVIEKWHKIINDKISGKK